MILIRSKKHRKYIVSAQVVTELFKKWVDVLKVEMKQVEEKASHLQELMNTSSSSQRTSITLLQYDKPQHLKTSFTLTHFLIFLFALFDGIVIVGAIVGIIQLFL